MHHLYTETQTGVFKVAIFVIALKPETTQISISSRMDKQIVIHSYNGILTAIKMNYHYKKYHR